MEPVNQDYTSFPFVRGCYHRTIEHLSYIENGHSSLVATSNTFSQLIQLKDGSLKHAFFLFIDTSLVPVARRKKKIERNKERAKNMESKHLHEVCNKESI